MRMETFHELYSEYSYTVQRLMILAALEVLPDGTVPGEHLLALYDALQEENDVPYPDNFYTLLTGQDEAFWDEESKDSGCFNLFVPEDGRFRIPFPEPTALPMTSLEEAWLAYALTQPGCEWLLGPETRGKLRAGLGAYQFDQWVHSSQEIPEDALPTESAEGNRLWIRTLADCILCGRPIRSEYAVNADETLRSVTLPLRLEYSVRDRLLYLLHYHPVEQRVIKSLLHKFLLLEPCPDAESDFSGSLQDLMEAALCPEPLVVRLKDVHNTLDRFLKTLNHFELRTINEEEPYCRVEVRYRPFEERYLLREVLSLGPNAVVLSPERLRAEAAAMIRAALER